MKKKKIVRKKKAVHNVSLPDSAHEGKGTSHTPADNPFPSVGTSPSDK